MIFSTITQNNLNLTADTTEIPAQYSNNIQFKFIQDNERFSGYIPTIYIGVYDSAMIECGDVINAGGAVVVDGDGVFAISNEIMYRNGFLAVGVTLTNNNENVSLKPVIYRIQASVGGLSPLPPDEGEWQQVVKAFVETLFNNWSAENLDPIKAQLAELISTAQTQQEKITSQQTQIDNAIGNMGDYEIVQEDPVQIRFKKGDGTFGETVDLGDGLASKAMVNAGYYTYKGISYGGSASNNGIDVAEIDGAYSQETTNGFQLFDASKLPTKSQGGATVTNNDGSFTVSGSGNTTDSYANSFEYALNVTLKEGTIYLKNVGNITNPYLSIEFKNSDGGVIKRLSLQGVEQSSASLTSDDVSKIQIVRYAIYAPASTTIQTGTIKPMLYQDGDGTFEPYTGGIASPNPEYPKEPKFVGDIGQNLFDASKLPTKSQGGATVTHNGDSSFTISGSGDLTGDFSYYYNYSHEETLKMLKVGKITLNQNGDDTTPYAMFRLVKGDSGLWLQLIKTVRSANITQEMLQDSGCYMQVLIYGQRGSTIKGGTIKPMLYQDGDGQYRPYSETPKYYLDFVTSGKNLFNINGNVNVDGYSKEQKTTNTVENGVLTCNVNSARNHGVGQRLYGLKGKTISVSAKLKSLGEATIGNIYIYESSGAYKAVSNATALDTVFAINNYTCKTDDIVVAFAGTGGTGVQFYDIMVNYGAKFVDYEPFTGFETTTVELNQPLRALPNGVKDTIENGIATRRVGEITFDGSEMWYKNSGSNSNNWMYYVTIAHIRAKGLCDSLLHKEIADINSDGARINRVGFNFNHNATVMYLNVGYYMQQAGLTNTVDNLKTWLQSNPITVWYELATPTTEQITLPTLPSWYPYTNAWVGTELQPSFVEWYIKTAGANQNDLTVIKEDISQLQTETTQLNNDVTKLMGAFTSVTDLTKQLFLLMHRVGDIIFSTSDENPSTIYGGTWVAWGKGQVPVGVDTSDSDFNTVEKTGGEKEHTLTVDEMPSHKHDFGQQFATTSSLSGAYGYYMIAGTQTDVIKNTGGNQPHNNLQPYITCYMWKRTA